jgi:hypothetical protein
MSDKGKIFLGLGVLVVVVAFPFWYTLPAGSPGPKPELELPAGETQCVELKDYMTAHHMEILNQWRDAVVRQGQKDYTSKAYGKTYEMSLTGTCMGCHQKRDTFCNRCHNYADVNPYCWDCHLEPQVR